MHECSVERRRGPDVRARQVARDHAHHHLPPVRSLFYFYYRPRTHTDIYRRPALMRYHTQLLTIAGDGTGRWALKRIGTAEERMDLDREIVMLENRLAEVEKWEARLKELERQLSVQEL